MDMLKPEPRKIILLFSNKQSEKIPDEIKTSDFLQNNICTGVLNKDENLTDLIEENYINKPLKPLLEQLDKEINIKTIKSTIQNIFKNQLPETEIKYLINEAIDYFKTLGPKGLPRIKKLIKTEFKSLHPEVIICGDKQVEELLKNTLSSSFKIVSINELQNNIKSIENYIKEQLPIPIKQLTEKAEIIRYFNFLKKKGIFSYYIKFSDDNPLTKGKILAIGFYTNGQKNQIVINGDKLNEVFNEFKELMEGTTKKICQNIQQQLFYLQAITGIKTNNIVYDPYLAEYILDGGKKSDISIQSQINKYTQFSGYRIKETDPYYKQASETAILNYMIYKTQSKALSEKQIALIQKILIPAAQTLSQIRVNGICIDDKKLRQYIDKFVYVLQGTEEKFRKIAQKYITSPNIQSNDHIKKILLEKIKLPYSKDSISTDFLMHYIQELSPDKIDLFIKNIKPNALKNFVASIKKLNNSKRNPASYKEKKHAFNIATNIEKLLNSNKISEAINYLRKSKLPHNYYFPVFQKTKAICQTNYTKDALKDASDICKLVLKFRQFAKVYSTYLVNITENLHPTENPYKHTLHAELNMTTTSTGRIASFEPLNIQNFPNKKSINSIQDKLKLLEYPFNPYPCPKEIVISRFQNGKIMEFDFSQMELRILGSLANEKRFIEGYKNPNFDLHTETAKTIVNKNATDSDRNKAKELNFGIIYGISVSSYAKKANISKSEAEKYIENYFKKYPNIKKFMQNIKETLKKDGVIYSITGRPRYFNTKEDKAIREAYNFPIQSAAADVVFDCIAKAHKSLQKHNLKSKIIATVHDSIILDVHPAEISQVTSIVKTAMETVHKRFKFLKTPMKVDIEIGDNWASLKKLNEMKLDMK